jgi:hypothetical protein
MLAYMKTLLDIVEYADLYAFFLIHLVVKGTSTWWQNEQF